MIRKVKISQLEGAPVPLSHYDAELMVSMKRRGQVIPLTVCKIPRTGWFWFLKRQRYEVVDGFRRLDAARRLGWLETIVWVIAISDSDLAKAKIIASKQHVPTDPVQYRKALLRILQINPTLTRDELAKRINWSRQRLDKVLDESA